MPTSLKRSIDSMEKMTLRSEESPSKNPLLLYIDKQEGCILTTEDKNLACPMYEIADWVQNLSNKCRPDTDASVNEDLKQLHRLFKKLWENYISQISLSR